MMLTQFGKGETSGGGDSSTSDGPQVVGGDGGVSICGGAGFFLGWLPLATAFRDPHHGTWFTPDNVADGSCRVRRAIAIPT